MKPEWARARVERVARRGRAVLERLATMRLSRAPSKLGLDLGLGADGGAALRAELFSTASPQPKGARAQRRQAPSTSGNNEWTVEDDLVLAAAVGRHMQRKGGPRGRWTDVAEDVQGGRSDSSCRHRWNNVKTRADLVEAADAAARVSPQPVAHSTAAAQQTSDCGRSEQGASLPKARTPVSASQKQGSGNKKRKGEEEGAAWSSAAEWSVRRAALKRRQHFGGVIVPPSDGDEEQEEENLLIVDAPADTAGAAAASKRKPPRERQLSDPAAPSSKRRKELGDGARDSRLAPSKPLTHWSCFGRGQHMAGGAGGGSGRGTRGNGDDRLGEGPGERSHRICRQAHPRILGALSSTMSRALWSWHV